ncbi:Dynein assembly factor 3, axonemal [Quaeritorhiza haematococci]|nr:Dynein assembly factor 3, axonemal [Quaeritorhiza haematococci]
MIDWDYHMKLPPKASIIHKLEYLKWRLHGNAFEVREAKYEKPNRTHATVNRLVEKDGTGANKWGHFSDIVLGPFVAFGVETDNKELLKKNNGIHIKTSQDVAENNLRTYIESLTEAPPTKITLLPCDMSIITNKRLRKYQTRFSIVYISATMAHHLTDSVKLLKDGGCIIVEKARYIIDFNADQIKAFDKKVLELAQAAGLVVYPTTLDNESDNLMFTRAPEKS